MKRSFLGVAPLLVSAWCATLSPAQPSNPGPFNPPPNGPRRADSTWVVLSDCTVHPAPGSVLPHATVVFRDGFITAVLAGEAVTQGDGAELRPARIPIGPRVISATGMHVYPAFVEPYADVDSPAPRADAPGRHWNESVTPERSALDGTGLEPAAAESLRKIGFGAAAIAPRGGVFRGSAAVVSLAKPADDRSSDRPPVYRESVYQLVSFDPGARGGYPSSQMGAIALIRQTFIDADWQQNARMVGGFDGPRTCLDALRRGQTEGAAPEFPLFVFNADDELESLRAAKIAREFHRPAVILGSGTEFRRLEAIKSDNLPYILPLAFPRTPDTSSPSKQDGVELRDLMTWEQAPTNPRRLAGAGIRFALTSAKARDRGAFLGNLRKAIACGLTEEQALASLTTIPAEMLGVQSQLGTVEVGKRANLLVTDGPVFDAKTKFHALWIDGRPNELYTVPVKLEGDWIIDLPGAPEAKRRLVIDDSNEITVHRDDKSVKATKVLFEGSRLSFSFDHDPLGGGSGIWVASAAVERDEDGAPVRMLGQGLKPDGTSFGWTAARAPKSLAGDWPIFFDSPDPAHQAGPVLRIDADKKVVIVHEKPGEDEALTPARNATWDGKTLSYELKSEDMGGAYPDVKVSATIDWSTRPPTIRGAVTNANGAFKFVGRRRDRERWAQGTWRVVSLDGLPVAADDPRQYKLELSQRRAAVIRAEKGKPDERQDVEDFKLDGATITFTHDLKIIGAEGKADDTLRRAGGEIVATAKYPDESTHTAVLRQEFADAKKDDDEDSALKGIPEALNTPFGPYGLPAYPDPGAYVLTNATLWTNTDAGILKGATLVISNGKITGVFPTGNTGIVPPPPGAVTIDCQGRHITPGIIDCHSHTGISKGVNEGGQAVTAECRIEDVTNPDTTNWYWQLAGGVTAVNNLHGSANAIGGQSQTNKIRWGVAHPDQMHMEGAAPGIKFALGENPRRANSGGGREGGGPGGGQSAARYPTSRMGVETLIRDRFTAAREYARLRAQTRKAGADREAGAVLASGGGLPSMGSLFADPPSFHRDLELDALADILDGSRLVHCHSYRQDEILMLCNVSRDFDFKIGTFQHILEGYKVADHVRDRSGGGSGFSDWWGYKVEVQDAIPGGLPLMHDVGCVVSFNSDSDELARRLNVEAGKAEKYGNISEEEALKFVTLNPARQLRIDNRVGTLEVGKDADVAVWNGAPMSAMSRCEMTFVDGRLLFSIEQDAKARAWIAAERERLIQKTLAESKRPARDSNAEGDRPGPGGPGGPGGRRGRFRPPQDQAQTDEQIEVLRQYYLDLMNRGKTPNEPGVCGCGLLHEW